MKLPATKKERIQVFILMGIGGIAVLYAGITLGVQPLFAKKAAYKKSIEDLEAKIMTAEGKIQSMRGDLARNKEALQKVNGEAERYVLRATIGENYLLGVDEMLTKYARAAGVEIGSPAEVGISDVPHNNVRPGKNVLKAYTARVTFRGGYADLLRFLREVETNSPYVCVSSISVTPQSDPEFHSITLDIQWPVWAERGMAEKVRQQLAEASDTEGKP